MNNNKLTKIIEKHQALIDEPVRDYIGASIIGSECLRQIWYEYVGIKAEKIAPKTRRTWDIGKRLESLILDWILESGIQYSISDESLSSKNIPQFKGHVDSFLLCDDVIESILEVKTAKDSSFKTFEKHGLKKWNYQYYCQVQSYMGMSGIHKTVIIVLNKDTSDLCDEEIEFDESLYKRLEDKAVMIVGFENPPPRVNNSPLWFQCKLCKFNRICHR